ncbi:flavoprotein [Phyllobacterium sp. 21LDTY02-6]|jgi:dihydromethanopterin reductase (acceptor)|uniref:flavoprotein n=1 Tax=unclassified Phyllobacterium TaxID=2638441 RepID=UPI0020215B8F|nr:MULTISPECIES: flavoprotein [unclassified Phyllobacterium]MCO4318198.1 flavoprotein [Phyllobacterium sp. 21LDTY02-6]MCX8280193.1 flavoprotein [Phyllobacterium sp. 0TCS1.6C]MCX8294246.1 flavoprotein [Phyllobacterium sp. 0TCS1.6A]
MTRLHTPRWAWALTGSGHFFIESFELIRELEHCDVFVSKAADEVLRMYKLKLDFPETTRVLHDKTASSVPVGGFYNGIYHTAVIAPATSNTVAKCVAGISDTLPTNVYAQAGKCLVPSIVYACDTAPELMTRAPGGMVKVYPRPIDLENTERLKTYERTEVVESIAELRAAIARRSSEIAGDG